MVHRQANNAVCHLVAQGTGFPAIHSDAVGYQMLLNAGYEPDDARDWNNCGCVVPHFRKTGEWTAAVNMNFGSAMEYALNQGYSLMTGEKMGLDEKPASEMTSFDEVKTAFYKQFDNLCRHSTPAKEYSTWSFQTGPFNNTACFGSLRCLPPPPEKLAEVTESLSRPHWSSLIRRYRDMKGDPAWRSVLKKFPAETAVLERIYANPPDHSRKAALFGETLRRIENSVRDADARDRIRIRKLLFDE